MIVHVLQESAFEFFDVLEVGGEFQNRFAQSIDARLPLFDIIINELVNIRILFLSILINIITLLLVQLLIYCRLIFHILVESTLIRHTIFIKRAMAMLGLIKCHENVFLGVQAHFLLLKHYIIQLRIPFRLFHFWNTLNLSRLQLNQMLAFP